MLAGLMVASTAQAHGIREILKELQSGRIGPVQCAEIMRVHRKASKTPERKAQAGYWYARCAHTAGKHGEAAAAWQELRESGDGTFWAALARRGPRGRQRGGTHEWEWRTLLQGLVDVESNGRVHAVSHAGAVGLMQVLPRTASAVMGERYTREQVMRCLYDARCNQWVGERYLKEQLNRYDGHVGLALAAYHSGPGNTEAARRHVHTHDPVMALDLWPHPKTRHYVREVLRRTWIRARKAGFEHVTWRLMAKVRVPKLGGWEPRRTRLRRGSG